MKYLAAIRYISAILVTLCILPVWARVYVTPLVLNGIEPTYLGLFIGGLLLAMALTWRLAPSLAGERWVRWAPLTLVVGWIVVLGVTAMVLVLPVPGIAGMLALLVLGTLWLPAATWLGYHGRPSRGRITVLIGLMLLTPLFPWQVRVNGLGGYNRVEFAWRSTPRPDYSGPRMIAESKSPVTIGDPSADDWPQYRGPHRNGIAAGGVRLADWSDQQPRELWRIPVGPGWSGFCVVNGFAFTQEQIGDDECVSCYRLADGTPVWRHGEKLRFESAMGGDGPRATPTFNGGRLYAVGATGRLVCLEAASGKKVWSADLATDFAIENNLDHGVCGSPLVDGDRVIVCPTGEGGPSLAAYHKDTGKLLWDQGTERASYSSPVIWEVDGSRQILLHNAAGLAGHDAATGRPLWLFAWTNSEGINCAQPILDAGGASTVLCSTGYGTGAALVRVKRDGPDHWVAEAVWRNARALKTKFTSPVLYDGYAYGLDDGILSCVEAATGRILWKERAGRYDHGQLILSGNRLIVQAESGEVSLVDPSPAKWTEVGRINALPGKTWTAPALAGNLLLVRNAQQAVCYELPTR